MPPRRWHRSQSVLGRITKADGDAIPAPRSFEQLRRDPEFIDDSADAIVTMVTPRTEMAAAE